MEIKNKIQAVGFYSHEAIKHPNSFEDLLIEKPTKIGDYDLLVEVLGTSVNPVDTFVRGGGRKGVTLKEAKIIGWDAIGRVVDRGKKVTLFNVGDKVWYAGDFKKSGSNTQYQLVDERIVGAAPKSLSVAEAAGIPLVGLTAYEALFEQMRVSMSPNDNRGKTILIINGAGGVGSMAVQLAKMAGLTVIATASRPESVSWVKHLGADFSVNHRENMVSQMHDLGLKQVDYILNLKDLDGHWSEIAQLIRPNGMVGATTENRRDINLQLLTKKRATFTWEWMYSKSFFKVDMISQHHILSNLAELFDDKTLKPITTKHYTPIDADNMKLAHFEVEGGHMNGKVTLTGW